MISKTEKKSRPSFCPGDSRTFSQFGMIVSAAWITDCKASDARIERHRATYSGCLSILPKFMDELAVGISLISLRRNPVAGSLFPQQDQPMIIRPERPPSEVSVDSGAVHRMQTNELLVIGAGPYGLAVAAHAKLSGIGVTVVGEPMAFWKHYMPAGMLLRSGLDWHLDAAEVHTLKAFLEEQHIARADAEPVPIEIFRRYADWFRQSKKIAVQPLRVTRLRRVDGYFETTCESGETIRASRVVVTPGLAPFINMPAEIAASLPCDRISHTATLVDFRSLANKRCLIVGGRQSAFEWAALIIEAGAESVDLVFRHDTPRFGISDWSFTDSMIESTLRVPGWFRRLDSGEQKAIQKQFWNAGRLQIEQWLWPRVNRSNVRLWPNSTVMNWSMTPSGVIAARLNWSNLLMVDQVILATGYRVDLPRVLYLTEEIASGRLKVAGGFPMLDDDAQTTVPGLYITGQAATRDQGPWFGFVRGCIASARIIIAGVKRA
jgi:thioredoxin reductase